VARFYGPQCIFALLQFLIFS